MRLRPLTVLQSNIIIIIIIKRIRSEPRKSMSILSAVESNKQMNMNTESTVSMNTNPEAAMPFTSRAYADEAIAKKVKGNEYAHHATLNFFIAFLSNAGLVAYTSQNFTN